MMYVILGDGEMPSADLKASLDDLMNKAIAEQATFWVTVQATSEPTATDRALMAWINTSETYYETVGPEAASADEIYAGTQEKHAVKGVAKKVVELMQTKPEDGEEAVMLALFASDDPDAPEDAELYQAVEAVLEAGFPVLALNDGLAEIKLSDGGEPAEPEPAPVTTPAKKVAGPKATAVPKDVERPADPTQDEAWATRENLEGLNIEEIKVIATRFGITLPPRTRVATYVDAILQRNEPEADTPEAEIDTPEEDPEPTVYANGESNGFQPGDILKSLMRHLGNAFLDAANR